MNEVTSESTEEFLEAIKKQKIKEIELPKADIRRDYFIMIGAYVFKHSDIQFITLVSNKDPTEIEIKNGFNFHVNVYTKNGVFQCATSTADTCIEFMKEVTDKVNDLIATQRNP